MSNKNIYREPCTGACCPNKTYCVHYYRHLEYTREGRIYKYVCGGNPSRCYANNYSNFIDVEGQK